MKRINVITTIEVPDDFSKEQIYDEFREIVRDTHNSKDLTCFVFADADTEDELY